VQAIPNDEPKLGNVQAGIIEGFKDLQQGRLLLVGLDNAEGVCRLIAHLKTRLLAADAKPCPGECPVFLNLAFTYAGLVLAGVDAGTLGQLSPEFREGMAARASILGDREHNHPMHWRLPERHGAVGARVELSEVHALVSCWLPSDNTPALDDVQTALEGALCDAGRVIAVQPMQRIKDSGGSTSGHFGFVDGISQPVLRSQNPNGRDAVSAGELLLGYRNDRGDAPLRGRLWNESTYMVVRKLRQDVQAFRDLKLSDPSKGQLMGRMPDGTELIGQTKGNDFDYANDPHGSKCPLFAHIRRANPRAPRHNEMDHIPRILRRGMSYGPPFDGGNEEDDRGLIFMAYNASISEQFEVIQGWLNGGNSSGSGSFSGQRDPFLGVARAGDPQSFPVQGGSVDIPSHRPLVTLEWGLYAFVPSLSALAELANWAQDRALEDGVQDAEEPKGTDDLYAAQRIRDQRRRETARQAALGSELIARLAQVERAQGFDAAVEHWKLALEDMGSRMKGHSQAIWTAVRKAHGGALRTPYGVLVCSRNLVEQVLRNPQGDYSVSGYNARLSNSFGQIYLGRDYAPGNDHEADEANAAIMEVTETAAFDFAHTQGVEMLNGLLPGGVVDITVEVKDLVDELLERCSHHWFGLPDGEIVIAGGWHWRNQATCPGHFHSPSRYAFQPQPGTQAREVGEAHGQILHKAVQEFVGRARTSPDTQGTLGRRLFLIHRTDNSKLATLIIGVMMGFLPTVDGNLRGTLYEWMQNRELWDLQARLLRSKAQRLEAAKTVIEPELTKTMHSRPVPEVIWRTALRTGSIGPVNVRVGDTVVVSLVSALQEGLLEDKRCPHIVFGGDREAAIERPAHSCPGRQMAMGVMLGFLTALMETVSMRPALSPMALRISKR
jgi:Dyp-type peroxidase family